MKFVVALGIISFVQILFASNGQTFKGIKMCERDCELTKGCTGIYYDPVHLECRLLFNKKKSGADPAPAVTRRIVKTSVTVDALKICSDRDRVVISGMGKHVCVPTEDTSQYFPSGRVLLAHIGPRALLSQLTLGREVPTVNTYPYLKPLQVVNMQYSSDLQSLFIAQENPDNIFAVRYRKRKQSVIRNGRYSALCVDGRNGLLFAVGGSRKLYRMTTQGRLLRPIYYPPKQVYVRSVTINPQHQLVYIVLYDSKNAMYDVISLKYSGGDVDVLFERTQDHILYAAFDQMYHSLVYAQNSQLMSYDPSTKEQKHSVLTTVDDIRGITAYQGALYFVDGNSLVQFSYRKEKKETLAILPGYYSLVCVID